MIREDDFIVVYDDEIGAVWMPECGGLKKTTSEHAKSIEQYINSAYRHELSEEDEQELEIYLRDSFKNVPLLKVKKCPNLFERKKLSRLEIMVANDCNLNCKYCYAKAGTYGLKKTRMSAEMAKEYLHKLLDEKYESVDNIMFFGGEPTLCPETIEAVCEFFALSLTNGTIKKLPHYTMVTNATLINEKMAEIIYKYNIYVTVSVDGPREITDLLRIDKNGKGVFKKIEEGICQIEKAGGKVVMLEATYTKLHEKMGYTRKYIENYLQNYFGVDNICMADCEETDENNELAFKNEKIIDTCFYEKKIQSRVNCKEYEDITCEAGNGSMAVMPDGSIYPCHFFVEYPEYCIATYKDGQYDFSNYQIILKKMEMAHHTKNSNCKDCWSKSICTRCPANMLLKKIDGCERIREVQKEAVLKCAKSIF